MAEKIAFASLRLLLLLRNKNNYNGRAPCRGTWPKNSLRFSAAIFIAPQ